MKLVSLSISRPSLVFVLFAILTLGGVVGWLALPYELLPAFSPPNITITAVYPGAAPPEVEEKVTRKLEDLISGVEQVQEIHAQSFENFALLRLELAPDADVDAIESAVQKKIAAGRRELPAELEEPSVGKFSFDDLPIIKLAVRADLPSEELSSWLEEQVVPAFARLKGVARVTLLGQTEPVVEVNLLPHRLEAYRVSIGQVLQAIGRENVELPAGRLERPDDPRNGGQVLVRLAGRVGSLSELQSLEISTFPDGTPIFLEDLADIRLALRPPQVLVRANGREALGLFIQKQADANAVEVSRQVHHTLQALEHQYAREALRFEVLQDTSEFTLEAARGVFQDLLLAVILVAMVMFIFLKSLRNSLIIMFAVPLSLVATLGVMHLLGYTFNLLSLLGLTLAV
ncbi:MAG: efflux RND transporter permease subunit, partial [Bacteroidetes bacterium]